MAKAKTAIQLDSRNVRKHSPANKDAIERSLKECGAGRSIVTDANNVIIAGNGVFEQAQKLGIPVKVIKSNGKELIAIQRTDLKTDDDKRKALAIADNRLTDLSEFDTAALDAALKELEPDMQIIAGFTEEELKSLNIDFQPTEEVPRLDELEPQIVTCPFCKKEFDARKSS